MAKPSIPRACLNCQKPFLCTLYQFNHGWGKYCSRSCHVAHYPQQIAKRFWSKVEKTSGCWLWIGPKIYGYGSIGFRGKTYRAHRLAYELHYGIDPGGQNVCHSCDNPACVRPDHLWLGTHTDNHRDMEKKGRNRRGDQHWTHRHPEKIRSGERSYQRCRPDWLARGERHGNAKMTEEKVREMRDARKNGATYGQLMKRFNISKSVVANIVRGKGWKHVS